MYPNQSFPERNNAIPCQYKGINFRSLLEARWAYFFDKLGWTWQYEPFEMDGYIPDFLVTFSEDCSPIVVDVKPFFTLDYQRNVIEKCKPNNKYYYSLLFASTPRIKTYDTTLMELGYHIPDDDDDRKIEIKYYSIGESSFLDERPILDCCIHNIHNNRTFWPNEFLFSDYFRKEAVKAKTLQEGDFEPNLRYYESLIINDKIISYLYNLEEATAIACSDYNAMISQLESYWAEAQNATQYKPKTPQQFII